MFQCQTIFFMDVHLVKSEQNVGFVAVSITLAQIGFIYIYVYIHEYYIYIYTCILFIYIYIYIYMCGFIIKSFSKKTLSDLV